MDAPATQAIVKAVNAQSTKKKVQSQKVNAAPGAKKPSLAQYAKSDISSSRWKREQALKSLQAVTKLYDTVVQSAEQISGLTIVEERENVWRGVNGFAAYVKTVK
jgi:signal recognition particle subunit SRP68